MKNTDLQPSPTEFAIQNNRAIRCSSEIHWSTVMTLKWTDRSEEAGMMNKKYSDKKRDKAYSPPQKGPTFWQKGYIYLLRTEVPEKVTINTIKHLVSAKWYKLAVGYLMVEPNNWHFLPPKNSPLIVRDPDKSQANHQPLMDILRWCHLSITMAAKPCERQNADQQQKLPEKFAMLKLQTHLKKRKTWSNWKKNRGKPIFLRDRSELTRREREIFEVSMISGYTMCQGRSTP